MTFPLTPEDTLVRVASLGLFTSEQKPKSWTPDGWSIDMTWCDVERTIAKHHLVVVPRDDGDEMKQLADKINSWGESESQLQIESKINQGTKVLLNLKIKGKKA